MALTRHAPTPRSPALLSTLPPELLRAIFHFGARSLLPRETASIRYRRIAHRERASYLRNAALTCRAWRQQAQSELVSFAYCTTWSSLDRFTGFVRKTRRGKQVRKLRLNFQREEQGSKLWMTALRLWEVCPCLPGIDLDGQLTVSELYTVLNGGIASLQISHWSAAKIINLPETLTSLALIDCHFTTFGQAEFMRRLRQIFSSPRSLRHLTILGGTGAPPRLPPSTPYFPSLTSLTLDSCPLALSFLSSALPTITHVELVRPVDAADVARSPQIVEAVLRLPKLEELRIPRNTFWTGEGVGIGVRCVEKGVELVWEEGSGEWA